MISAKITGGQKLKRWMRKQKAAARKLDGQAVDVGFIKTPLAQVALENEYGVPERNLPERPAFRRGIDRFNGNDLAAIVKRVHVPGKPIGEAELRAGAEALFKRVDDSYRAGDIQPPLSKERVRQRGDAGKPLHAQGDEAGELINALQWRVVRFKEGE